MMNPLVKLTLFILLAAAIVGVLFSWWELKEKIK